MNDIRILLSALGLYITVLLVGWARAYRERQLRFAVKRDINRIRWLVHLVGTLYFLVGGITVVPRVVHWTTNFLASHPWWSPPNATYYFMVATPYVYMIAILYVACWIMAIGARPWFGYTLEERALLDGQKEEVRRKLEKWVGKRFARAIVR